jgi:hypothetical protein
MASAAVDRAAAGSAHPGAAQAEREWVGGELPQRPSLGAALGAMWSEFRGLVREHAALAVLEAQRAGINFAYLIAAVLIIAVLLVTAWLAVVTALILWLMGTGVSWPWVLLIVRSPTCWAQSLLRYGRASKRCTCRSAPRSGSFPLIAPNSLREVAMRRLRDLDEEIARAEARIGRRRDGLARAFKAARHNGRRAMASAPLLGAAFLAGFLLERLGSRRRHAPREPQKSGARGLIAGLAAVVARAAISNASVWAGPLFRRWAERRRERAQAEPTAEPGPGFARGRPAAERAETLH